MRNGIFDNQAEFGQQLPVSVAVEYSGKRPLTKRPAPGDPTTPLGTQRTYLSGAT